MLSLKEMSSHFVACSYLPIENLPYNLKETVTNAQTSLSKPSEITATMQFHNSYHRARLEMFAFPQYIMKSGFPYPVFRNLTSDIHSFVPNYFSRLSLQFTGTCNKQISDLLQFASDVSGCEIAAVDIHSVEYLTETEIVIHDSIYVIHHKFNGPLSILLDILMSFKYVSVSHISHYFRTFEQNGYLLTFEYLEKRDFIHMVDFITDY